MWVRKRELKGADGGEAGNRKFRRWESERETWKYGKYRRVMEKIEGEAGGEQRGRGGKDI